MHSFYRGGQPSGENLAVAAQIEALGQAAVEVALVGRWSDREVRHPWDPVRVALITATGRGGDPTGELGSLRPDLVHIHNLFPTMGTRWLGQWQGPIVATVHNYRPLCANGLLLRDGHFCNDCLSHGTLHAVRHGCYRDSRVATVPLAVATAGGARRNPVLQRADAVVFLSQTQREIYVDAGLDVGRTHVIPNGIPDVAFDVSTARQGWMFAGRLTPEKGLAALLSIWPDTEPLVVWGTGPLAAQMQAIAPGAVRWCAGDQADVARALKGAEGLVFPSLAMEVHPTVVIEALRAGTPIVAREATVAAALVERFGVGAVYDGGAPSLRSALAFCRQGGSSLRTAARDCYVRNFTQDRWVEDLKSLYSTVL